MSSMTAPMSSSVQRAAMAVIAASSAHRRDALGAVSDAIDQLKVRVPIWKKEIGLDDEQRWLDGHSLREE